MALGIPFNLHLLHSYFRHISKTTGPPGKVCYTLIKGVILLQSRCVLGVNAILLFGLPRLLQTHSFFGALSAKCIHRLVWPQSISHLFMLPTVCCQKFWPGLKFP